MRLIDADTLYELIDGGFDFNFDEVPETKRELLRIIDEQETIDAEPVKHGRWIWDDEGYHCSECLFHAYDETLNVLDGTYKYCPYCGAKMEESNEQDI